MFGGMSTDTNNSRSLNAARVARHYHRRKFNRAVMSVEVDWVALSEMLVHQRFLAAWDARDRTAIRTALQTFLEVECRYYVKEPT